MSNALIKSHLESAIKSNSNFSQAHYELAKIFLEETDVKSAIKSLTNAITSEKKSAFTFEKRGKSLFKKRQFLQAKRHMFKMGLTRYNTSIYYSELAQIYLDVQDIENAKKYAQKSVKEYSNQPNAMNILGQVYASSKKWKLAIDWFTKSLELDFKNAATHLLLAHVKQYQKKPKEAVHHYLIAKDLDKFISSPTLDRLSQKHPEL